MYAGHIVEAGRVKETFAPAAAPLHPGAAGVGARLRPAGAGADPDPWLPAEPRRPADGLPVRPAVRLRARRTAPRPPPPLVEVIPGRLAACYESDRLVEVLTDGAHA